MNIKRSTLMAIGIAVAASAIAVAALTDEDKKFLAGYEKAHQSLAADDLTEARKAATELGDSGNDLAKSDSLADARNAFAKLSDEAKKRIAGQPGYHLAYCPMVKKDWVQTSEKIVNPYGGKKMLTCGKITK